MNMTAWAKTAAGTAAFKERSALMSLRQRSIFLLCDGQRSVEAVLEATASIGAQAADVEALVGHGFLVMVPGALETPRQMPPLQLVQPEPSSESPADGRSLYVEHWTLF